MSPIFHPFTVSYGRIVNQILTEVAVSEAYDVSDKSILPPKQNSVWALWDTGATRSCFCSPVLEQLNLPPIGTTKFGHAGGSDQCFEYLVNIFLPNNVCIIATPVMGLSSLNGNFKAIIGMDIISNGDFAITNSDGQTTVSFRIPSTRKVDFAFELFSGTDRNLPCPCGAKDQTGKTIKFKHCHGR